MESTKELDTTNVFVKYLPQEVDDLHLFELFSPFGRIVSAKVMVDPLTCKSLGYGFVKYSKREEAEEAIKQMVGYTIDKKTLLCKFSNAFSFTPPSANLYVKPLPPDFTEDMLRKVFGEFGEVQSAKIVRDPSKPQDVVGLVRFESEISAMNAVHSINGKVLLPNWQPVIVKYAESDKQRSTRKANISPPRPRRQVANHQSQFANLVAKIGFTPNYVVCPQYLDPASTAPYEARYFMAPAVPGYPQIPQIYRNFPQSSPIGWYNSYDKLTYPSRESMMGRAK